MGSVKQCGRIVTDKVKKEMITSMNKSEKEKREFLYSLCETNKGDIMLSGLIGKSGKLADAGIELSANKLRKACQSKGGKVIGDFHTHPFVHSKENLGEEAKDVYVSGGDIMHLDVLSKELKTNFTGCIGGKIKKNGVLVNRVRCFDNDTIRPFVRETAIKMNGNAGGNVFGFSRNKKKRRISQNEYDNAAQETAYILDEQNKEDEFSCRNDF